MITNKIVPINFENFHEGDSYYIIQERGRSGPIIYSAKVGHFRKGIAIASTNDFDCLIDVNCKIVFQPMPVHNFWGYGCGPRPSIKRILGGKYLLTEGRDISAPGKDSYYENKYTYLNENGTLDEESPITRPPYPMETPYERGKIIHIDDCYYDLESYRLLFKLPPNLSIISKFDENGECEVLDSSFSKTLLVNVNKSGDIVSYKEVPENSLTSRSVPLNQNLYIEWRKDIDSCMFSSFLKPDFPIESISLEEVTDDVWKDLYQFCKKTNNTDIGSYKNLFNWIKKVSKTNKFWKINIRKDYFWFDGTICVLYGVIIIARYTNIQIYDSIGLRIAPLQSFEAMSYLPHSDNFTKDNIIFLVNNSYSHGCSGCIIIKFDGTVDYIDYYEKFPSSFDMQRFFIEVNQVNNSYNVATKRTIEDYVVVERTHFNSYKDYTNFNFYDVFLNPLKKHIVNKCTNFKPVIKNYKYAYVYQNRWHNSIYDLRHPIRISNDVYVHTENILSEIEHNWEEVIPKRDDVNINCYFFKYDEETEILQFVFRYQPIGKLKNNGDIFYPTPPSEIRL